LDDAILSLQVDLAHDKDVIYSLLRRDKPWLSAGSATVSGQPPPWWSTLGNSIQASEDLIVIAHRNNNAVAERATLAFRYAHARSLQNISRLLLPRALELRLVSRGTTIRWAE
jgi:hypothetical protein